MFSTCIKEAFSRCECCPDCSLRGRQHTVSRTVFIVPQSFHPSQDSRVVWEVRASQMSLSLLWPGCDLLLVKHLAQSENPTVAPLWVRVTAAGQPGPIGAGTPPLGLSGPCPWALHRPVHSPFLFPFLCPAAPKPGTVHFWLFWQNLVKGNV